MVLIIFAFSVSESSVVMVTLKDWFQYAAVPFRQGATFHCHLMHCGAIQTRGNFPLPCSVLQTRGNFPLLWVRGCASQRVSSALVEQWSFAKIVFENFYWGWLIFSKIVSFSKTGPFSWTQKRKIFSAHSLTCMISDQKLNKHVNLTLMLVKIVLVESKIKKWSKWWTRGTVESGFLSFPRRQHTCQKGHNWSQQQNAESSLILRATRYQAKCEARTGMGQDISLHHLDRSDHVQTPQQGIINRCQLQICYTPKCSATPLWEEFTSCERKKENLAEC